MAKGNKLSNPKIHARSVRSIKNPEKLRSSPHNDIFFSIPNKENKKKTRDLIYRLLKFRDELKFSFYEDTSIKIESDYYMEETKKSTGTKEKRKISELDFKIEILKNIGFIINYNGKKTAFIDRKLYKNVIKRSKIVFSYLNNENFNNSFNSIMVDSGIARESNLDNLLP